MVYGPSNVVAVAQNNTVIVSWDPPSSAPATYTITPVGGSGVTGQTGTSYTFSNLTRNTWYNFTVAGVSPASGPTTSNSVFTTYSGILYTKKDKTSPKDYTQTNRQLRIYTDYPLTNTSKDPNYMSSVGFWRDYNAGLYKSRNS